MKRYLPPAATLFLVLAFWWFASILGLVNPLFLPTIGAVAEAALNLLSKPGVYVDLLVTCYRALTGLLLSIAVGVPLGLFFGRFTKFYRFFELPVDFFRSIPSSALFFLFILIFGLGNGAKVAIVVYGCSLILLVNTMYGVKPNREKTDRINMLRSFGANSFQIFELAVVRDAIPNIMAGLRICISLALVLVVVSEMFLSSNDGLGRRLYDSYLTYQIPEMYVVLIILGLIGFALNKVALLLERRLSFWKSETQEGMM